MPNSWHNPPPQPPPSAATSVLQVTIQEGRFVILSHQRAEGAIAAHAVQLTTDLGDTATELADLFSKFKSSLQITSGDRDALKVRNDTTTQDAEGKPYGHT